MSELDLFDARIDCETFCKHSKSVIRQIVVAHMEDLKITVSHQRLLDRLNLGISELIANEIKFANRNLDKKG